MSWYVGLFTHPTNPSAQGAKPKPLPDPNRIAIQRDQLARIGAVAAYGAGRQATVLTGQAGAAGQPEISVPSLLGR
jgi:hypothetical protein